MTFKPALAIGAVSSLEALILIPGAAVASGPVGTQHAPMSPPSA